MGHSFVNAVDKCSLEQQFCKLDTITFVVLQTGAVTLAQPGLMADRQADEMLLHLKIFVISRWNIGNLAVFRKVQCHYSCTNTF